MVKINKFFQTFFVYIFKGEFFNEGRIDYVLSQTSVDKVLTYSLPLHVKINFKKIKTKYFLIDLY